VVFAIREKPEVSREDVERVLENLDPEFLCGCAKYYLNTMGRNILLTSSISCNRVA